MPNSSGSKERPKPKIAKAAKVIVEAIKDLREPKGSTIRDIKKVIQVRCGSKRLRDDLIPKALRNVVKFGLIKQNGNLYKIDTYMTLHVRNRSAFKNYLKRKKRNGRAVGVSLDTIPTSTSTISSETTRGVSLDVVDQTDDEDDCYYDRENVSQNSSEESSIYCKSPNRQRSQNSVNSRSKSLVRGSSSNRLSRSKSPSKSKTPEALKKEFALKKF